MTFFTFYCDFTVSFLVLVLVLVLFVVKSLSSHYPLYGPWDLAYISNSWKWWEVY